MSEDRLLEFLQGLPSGRSGDGSSYASFADQGDASGRCFFLVFDVGIHIFPLREWHHALVRGTFLHFGLSEAAIPDIIRDLHMSEDRLLEFLQGLPSGRSGDGSSHASFVDQGYAFSLVFDEADDVFDEGNHIFLLIG